MTICNDANKSTSSLNTRDMLEHYFDCLWPLCRSITGPGYRDSLNILSEVVPIDRLKFNTAEKVFDWHVPKEWIVRDAYLKDPNGVKRCCFKTNNLHLLGYSTPFFGRMPLSALRSHLHTLPSQPKAIPYLTSYYEERWGFCLSHEEFASLPEGMYEVFVDTELIPGQVEIGEAVIPGSGTDEILFSAYLCHPSMANNELSGPLVWAGLYERILSMPARRYTYRFAIMPETIGAICYLTRRGEHLIKNLIAGYQMTCLGDKGEFTYKRSRRGNCLADRAAERVLADQGRFKTMAFDPTEGADERQYCSPGFDLPVGCLRRSLFYPEYHTSLDNKDFISFDALTQSIDVYFNIVLAIENNIVWRNTLPYGEPHLGSRGLYPTLGSQKSFGDRFAAILWVLSCADGRSDLLAVAEKSGMRLDLLITAANELAGAGLLEEIYQVKQT